MEKLKEKHDHKLTHCLKVLIFSLIMLAPFFAILTNCLVMIFNEQATGIAATVFYDAIQEIANQPIFNWTTSTGIYTPISSMLTGLDMGTGSNILAILLTYWAINTAIYIVFDIIVFCFTKITHIIE